MQRLHDNLPIVLAAVLSVLLHAFVLFPALGLIGAGSRYLDGTKTGLIPEAPAARGEEEIPEKEHGRTERRAENARRALQERRERERERLEEERDRDVRLGIDESDAATMNWIGYDEYREHLAELAEVEQAAFRLEAASGSQGTASPLLPPAPPTPTVAVSPNPSPLPLPAAAAGADGTPPSTLVVEPAVDPATAPPAAPPTEVATTLGADAESARPLPPPEGTTDTPAAPAAAAESNPAPTEIEGPPAPTPEDATANPEPPTREPDPVAPRVAPTPLDPTRTDPAAPPVDDPNAKPDPSTVDPLKRLDPAQPGTDPAATPRDSEPQDDPTRRPPVETPREADPNRTEGDATAGSDMRAPNEQRPADSAGTSGGGIDGPQPVDGASSTPSQPSPAGVPGDSLARTGDLSDRESDPTSIIDVPMQNWQNGRPLAAKGIVLKPVRPRFTTLNYVDGVGRNPVGELIFGRDGVPIQTRLLRSTGNPGVDEAIRSALFKWRASGRQLEQLKPGQTLTIRMRLIMLAD